MINSCTTQHIANTHFLLEMCKIMRNGLFQNIVDLVCPNSMAQSDRGMAIHDCMYNFM